MTKSTTRKSGAQKVAEHFGEDVAYVREYEYQPGRWSSPVFFLSDVLWSAGRGGKPPKRIRDDENPNWETVTSDGGVLFKGLPTEDD